MTDHLDSTIFGDHDGPRDPLTGDDGVPAIPTSTRRQASGSGASRRGRSGRRGTPRGAKPPVWKRLLVIVLALAVVAGGAAVAFSVLRPVVDGFLESNDYAGPGEGELKFTVAAGAGGAKIADRLVEGDVVKSSKAFNEAAAENDEAKGIQPGVYTLRRQMKASDALAVLVDPANRVVTRVVVPEGLWASEIYAKLSQQTGIPKATYAKAARNAKALKLPVSAKGNVEGYLFPASYEFNPGTSATDQLSQMVAQSTKRLSALGLTPQKMERAVIVASLVEGEANTDLDRGKVARVIENRLKRNTSLGFDSTVNYIFKKRGVPTQAMLNSGNPYNTRRFKGLPPGPIANPGESAIKAAVDPPAGPWFWFTTVNLCTGETRFAVSAAAHQKNVAAFNAWTKATGGKC